MRNSKPGQFTASLSLLLALIAASPNGRAESGTNYFGFSGPETFPIDNFIGQIKAADFDGDGLIDLAIANNSRARINLLFNQTGRAGKAKAPAARVKRELNELPPDSRFRIESVASEKRISSMEVADFNGDGRPDIAYYGEPKELVIIHNQGTNGWSAPKCWPIDDGQLTPGALVVGDLNGDKLTDLVLLGDSAIYLLAQQADHTMGEPEKIPYSETVKGIQVLDIDGDGRDDLLLVHWESANPIRFRLQNAAAQLGPEIHFVLPPIRSYCADDLDGDKKAEIITIAQSSGRAQVSRFAQKPAEKLSGGFAQGQFLTLPLAKTTKAKRGMEWADVNGDELPDLLVAEPDQGRLTLFLQQPDGTLAAGKSYPTLTGVSDLAVARTHPDQPAEILLLSADERQVGVTRFDQQGRVAFPTPIPLEGKPLAMAVGPLRAKAAPTLAVILDQDGKRALLTRAADGTTKTQKLAESFKSNPSSMSFHDVNQDGLADLVILIPYEKVKVLLQVEGKDFEEQDVAPPGGTVEQPWMSIADVDGDGKAELLLAQKNFLRAVVLKAERQPGNETNKAYTFSVKDQVNGAASNSRIVAAAPLRNGKNAVPSLFLLDAERKALTLSERDTNGVWQVIRNVPLPSTDFSELRPLALAGAAENSIAFMGLNVVAWSRLKGDVWELKELDGYETPIKDGRLNDVVVGDLNQDKRKDLVFMETAKNHLDLVILDHAGKLIPANRWQVFEERTFRGRRGDIPEPREAVIADFTGDGKNDLAVIVHDRVLLYPQE